MASTEYYDRQYGKNTIREQYTCTNIMQKRNKANEQNGTTDGRTHHLYRLGSRFVFDKRGLTDSIQYSIALYNTIKIHFVHEVVRSIVCMCVCECIWWVG